MLITINEPHGAYYGAAVALPPARDLLEKLIKYKGIEPSYIPDIEERNKSDNIVVAKNTSKPRDLGLINLDLQNKMMPDLSGLSLRQIISLSSYKKYKNIKFKGHGKVVSQSVKLGTKIDENTPIIIELK